MHIKLVLHIAAWLHIFLGKKMSIVVPPWVNWLRLYYWWDREEKRPSSCWDLNPRHLDHEACALPLRYNCCPQFCSWRVLLFSHLWLKNAWLQSLPFPNRDENIKKRGTTEPNFFILFQFSSKNEVTSESLGEKKFPSKKFKLLKFWKKEGLSKIQWDLKKWLQLV